MLKNSEWECVICNDPDNNYELCADIRHGNNTAAFIKNKDGKRIITLYEKGIDIPFDWFFEAMQIAKDRVS